MQLCVFNGKILAIAEARGTQNQHKNILCSEHAEARLLRELVRRHGYAKARKLWQSGKASLIIEHPLGKCSLPCRSCAHILNRTCFGGKILCRDVQKEDVCITVSHVMEMAKPSSGQRRRDMRRDNTTT